MKSLIVEDEFVSRQKMVKILSGFGQCDTAMNGTEAISAFNLALEEGEPYDLITMDIVMPDMDGHEASKKIRAKENILTQKMDKPSDPYKYVKILMVSVLHDSTNIVSSFTKDDCDGYIIKPFTKEKVVEQLFKIGLLSSDI